MADYQQQQSGEDSYWVPQPRTNRPTMSPSPNSILSRSGSTVPRATPESVQLRRPGPLSKSRADRVSKELVFQRSPKRSVVDAHPSKRSSKSELSGMNILTPESNGLETPIGFNADTPVGFGAERIPRAAKSPMSRERTAEAYNARVRQQTDKPSKREGITKTPNASDKNTEKQDRRSNTANPRKSSPRISNNTIGGPRDQRNSRHNVTRAEKHLETPKAEIYDIEFPTLRSVLWDRRVQDGPIVLGPCSHIPSVSIRRALLATMYNRFSAKCQCKSGSIENTESETLQQICESCLTKFTGSTTRMSLAGEVGSWVGGSWNVLLDGIGDPSKDDYSCVQLRMFKHKARQIDVEHEQAMQKAGGRGTSGYDIVTENSERSLNDNMTFTDAELRNVFESANKQFLANGPGTTTQFVSLHGVCSVLPNARLLVRIEALVPSVSFSFTKLNSIPVLSTPLARFVLNGTGLSTQASDDVQHANESSKLTHGFLTLNQTRQIVMLLEDDPEAYRLPLVGIWLAAEQFCDQNSTDSKSWRSWLSQPALWARCLHFLHDECVAERAGPVESRTTFIIMLVSKSNDQVRVTNFVECTPSVETSHSYQTDSSSIPMARFESGFEVDVIPPVANVKTKVPTVDQVDCKFHVIENVERRLQGKSQSAYPLLQTSKWPVASLDEFSVSSNTNDKPQLRNSAVETPRTLPPSTTSEFLHRYTDGIARTPPKLPLITMHGRSFQEANVNFNQDEPANVNDEKEKLLLLQQQQIEQLTSQVSALTEMVSKLLSGQSHQPLPQLLEQHGNVKPGTATSVLEREGAFVEGALGKRGGESPNGSLKLQSLYVQDSTSMLQLNPNSSKKHEPEFISHSDAQRSSAGDEHAVNSDPYSKSAKGECHTNESDQCEVSTTGAMSDPEQATVQRIDNEDEIECGESVDQQQSVSQKADGENNMFQMEIPSSFDVDQEDLTEQPSSNIGTQHDVAQDSGASIPVHDHETKTTTYDDVLPQDTGSKHLQQSNTENAIATKENFASLRNASDNDETPSSLSRSSVKPNSSNTSTVNDNMSTIDQSSDSHGTIKPCKDDNNNIDGGEMESVFVPRILATESMLSPRLEEVDVQINDTSETRFQHYNELSDEEDEALARIEAKYLEQSL